MVVNFPSASQRTPDLYNYIRIHAEETSIQTAVLSARYNGDREVTVNTSTFTNTSLNTAIELDNQLIGTSDFATNTEAAVTPGNTLQYNSNQLTFQVIVDGTVELNDTDSTIAISVNGNLQLGSTPTPAALNTTMTLDDVVVAVNSIRPTTGISAETVLNSGNGKYFLRLTKDNTTDVSTLIIDATSTASILTDLGFAAATYVIDIVDVASQIGADGSVNGAVPYNIQIDNANGIYLIGGTAVAELGLTKTIDLTTETIRLTAHGLANGAQVSLTSSGNLPVPFNVFPGSFYYAIVVDANNIRLATTRTNALEGTAINITSEGNDYFTVKETTDSEIYYQVWQGLSTDNVFKQRMDEVIAWFEEKDYIIFRQTNPSTNSTFQWVVRW